MVTRLLGRFRVKRAGVKAKMIESGSFHFKKTRKFYIPKQRRASTMQQGNRHCTANIRNTRAHSSRGWRIRKRRNRTLQVVGRFLTLFVLTLVLAVGIMLSGAALLGWWPSQEIPRQGKLGLNHRCSPPRKRLKPLTVDVTGINSPYALLMCRERHRTRPGEVRMHQFILPP